MTEKSPVRELLAEVRAQLAWELELGGFGVPVVARDERARPADAGRAPELAAAQPSPFASGPRPQAEASAPASAYPAPLAQPEGGDRLLRLAVLEERVRTCTACELARGRTKTVFARGNPHAPLVFIGEGPGQDEDLSGLPFVGAAGKLLDKMIGAMGLTGDDVYICNVVKCRPPGNRTPLPTEAAACASYLQGQLEAVSPRVIVALGRCAAENLGLVEGGGWRGRWGRYRGTEVMPTYHPAFLLRSPEFKRPVWEDLQKVMAKLKA